MLSTLILPEEEEGSSKKSECGFIALGTTPAQKASLAENTPHLDQFAAPLCVGRLQTGRASLLLALLLQQHHNCPKLSCDTPSLSNLSTGTVDDSALVAGMKCDIASMIAPSLVTDASEDLSDSL